MPLVLCAVLTRVFGSERSWRPGLAMWPLAVFSALAMTVPYVLTAWLLGPEFPSLFGGMIGRGVVTWTVRRGWLVPRSPAWDFGPPERWPSEWSGLLSQEAAAPEATSEEQPSARGRAAANGRRARGCRI